LSNYYPHITSVSSPTAFRIMQDAGRFGHVQTTNNVLTEIARFPVTEYSSCAASMTIYVTGIRLSNGGAVSFAQELGVKRLNGGDVELIGFLPSPKVSKDSSMSLADFSVTESGPDVVVSVKGLGSATIDWCCQIHVNHLFGVS
jgi:hypothetical protein